MLRPDWAGGEGDSEIAGAGSGTTRSSAKHLLTLRTSCIARRLVCGALREIVLAMAWLKQCCPQCGSLC